MNRLARNTSIVMAGLVGASLVGLLRQIIFSRALGASADPDAYFAAFRVPDLLFNVMAGGALASAFIPLFTGFLVAEGGHERAWRLASAVVNNLLIALGVVGGLAALAAPWLVRFILAPAFTPAQQALTVDLMRIMLDHGQSSLERTPELLAILKESGVVDAGGKAFILLLEGIVRLIEGDPIVPAAALPAFEVPYAAAQAEVAAERDFSYCTEVMVRGSAFPPSTEIRQALRAHGGSIVVLASDDLLKVHIHTDEPQQVFALAASWGAVETTKADDMRAQQAAQKDHARRQRTSLHGERRPLSLVVDSSCDLPDTVLDRYGIVMVPIQVIEGDKTYLDRIGISREVLYQRMREGTIFTTSQPTPAAFVQGFEDALSGSDAVLAVLLAKSLSGTFASGQAAAKALEQPITLVDSRSASLGLGLLALRGAELIEQGWDANAIAAELTRVRDQSGGLFTVDIFDNLLRSGRVGRGRAWLGTLLDVKPILEVSHDGRVVPLDRVRGRDALIPRVLRHLDRRLTPRPEQFRIGIVHVDAPAVADRLRADIEARYRPRDCFVSEVTAALGVHTGPGAWGIFYQIEDPSPSPQAGKP